MKRWKTTPPKPPLRLLAQLNLKSLSFVQLRRLQKVLTQAATEIDQEIKDRAEADNFGDTVTVPPQNI